MVRIIRIAIVFIIVIMFVACSKPSMRYHRVDDNNFTSLKEGEMLFKLRSTNIIIWPRSAGDVKDPLSVAKPLNVCPTESSVDSCLAEAMVKPFAKSDGDYYIAVPSDWSPWSRTGLAAETVDGDDSFIRSVAVTFNDQTKQAITRAGTAAVAGFGIAGPFGAVGGAMVALTASLPPSKEKGLELQIVDERSFTKYICKSDKVTAENVNKPDNIALTLPVSIDLKEALQRDDSDKGNKNGKSDKNCWHLLPNNPSEKWSAQYKQKKGNGWLYRITLGKKPLGAQSPSEYFAKANNNMEPKHDFPFTPCQDAWLHLVWWSTVQGAIPPEGPVMEPSYKYWVFPVNVANSDYVQVAPLPRAGSIKLGTVCGANVKYDTYSGSTIGDAFDAAVTAAKNIKSAQDEYNKAQ